VLGDLLLAEEILIDGGTSTLSFLLSLLFASIVISFNEPLGGIVYNIDNLVFELQNTLLKEVSADDKRTMELKVIQFHIFGDNILDFRFTEDGRKQVSDINIAFSVEDLTDLFFDVANSSFIEATTIKKDALLSEKLLEIVSGVGDKEILFEEIVFHVIILLKELSDDSLLVLDEPGRDIGTLLHLAINLIILQKVVYNLIDHLFIMTI